MKILTTLHQQITQILQTESSLYEFLFQQYKEQGVLEKSLLTESVLERLFTDENKIDALTGELFGLEKKQVARLRQKYGITLNSPRHRLRLLQRGIDKNFDRAVEWMGEETAIAVREMTSTL